MADPLGGMDRADRPGKIGRLAEVPRAAKLLGLVLKVATRHVEPDRVAVDMVERRFNRDVAPALAQRRYHLDLEMVVGGFRRIRKLQGLARGHGEERVSRLHEEKRRLAVRVVAHLARVGGVVAPDAVDPPHRKQIVGPHDGQGRARRLLDDVEHGARLGRKRMTIRTCKPVRRTDARAARSGEVPSGLPVRSGRHWPDILARPDAKRPGWLSWLSVIIRFGVSPVMAFCGEEELLGSNPVAAFRQGASTGAPTWSRAAAGENRPGKLGPVMS